MYEFSGTEEVITFCFADFSIRSNAKGLVLEKLNGFESDRSVQLSSHRLVDYSVSIAKKLGGVYQCLSFKSRATPRPSIGNVARRAIITLHHRYVANFWKPRPL